MKTTKTLSGVALGLQVVTVIIIVLMTVMQQSVKEIFASAPQLAEVVTFPTASLIIAVCPAIFYLMLLVMAQAMESKGSAFKTLAVVIFVLVCLAKVLLGYLPTVENVLAAREGVEKLASLSTLNSAISMVTSPFSTVSFGLFAMAVGTGIVRCPRQDEIGSINF